MLTIFNNRWFASLLFRAIIISVFLKFGTATVWAEQISFSISPSVINVQSSPGENFSVDYEIKNNGDPTIAIISFARFIPGEGEGMIRIIKDNDTGVNFYINDRSGLTIGKEFFFKDNEVKKITLSVNIDENATDNDYYYLLSIKNTPASPMEAVGSVRIVGGVSSALILSTTKKERKELKAYVSEITPLTHHKLTIAGKKLYVADSGDKVGIRLKVANAGANSLTVSGSITSNKQVLAFIRPTLILSRSSKLIKITGGSQSSLETMTMKGFATGRQNLSAAIRIDDTNKYIFANSHFYALPFKASFAALVGLILAILTAKLFWR